MNNVSLIAVIKTDIDDMFRQVEYGLPCFNEKGVDTQVINCKYWPNSPKSRFNQLQIGTKIAICGHLDAHEKFGTILIVEQFETLK